MNIFIIEGLDRLGKSTLIEGIRNKLGYYEVIHFSKPQNLEFYDQQVTNIDNRKNQSYYLYQRESFINMMRLCTSDAKIIFDRAHLGEAVYSPMYRGYNGDYVFDLEKQFNLYKHESIKLILLTEDFAVARHFIDDGQSLGPVDRREEEQMKFIEAFHKSSIQNKCIICVTDRTSGGFRPKEDILEEALK